MGQPTPHNSSQPDIILPPPGRDEGKRKRVLRSPVLAIHSLAPYQPRAVGDDQEGAPYRPALPSRARSVPRG